MLTLCPIREKIVGLVDEHLGHHGIRYELPLFLGSRELLRMVGDAHLIDDDSVRHARLPQEWKTRR